jgi:release factor glutamine methyltransferase
VARGDLFEPLKEMVDARPFDLVVANPPYIPTEAIAKLDRNVRDYEPMTALDGGMDGLVVHRRIIQEAPERLRGGGRIYLEIQFDQGAAVSGLLNESGAFDEVKVLKDFGGNERVVTGRRK